METSLPSIWPYLVAFVLFTIIFHVWLVYLRPISEIMWRKVDYIWLGLSVAAILLAANQWRSRVAAETLKETSAAWHNQTVAGLLEPAKGMRVILCQKGQSPDTAGCKWFDSMIADMEEAGDTTSGWLAVALLPTNQLRADFKEEADHVITRIWAVRTEALGRQRLEFAAKQDNGYLALLVPLYLLPIALALRITKRPFRN